MGTLTAEALDKLKMEAIANLDSAAYYTIERVQMCAYIKTKDGVTHEVVWALKPATKEDVERARNLLDNCAEVGDHD